MIVLYQAIEPATGSPPFGRLPELRLAEAGGVANPGAGERERVVLDVNGRAGFHGEVMAAGELAERLERNLPDGRAIELAVETRPDGTGHLEAFLQIQSDLSRRGLWSRTETLYQRPAPDQGPASARDEARRSP